MSSIEDVQNAMVNVITPALYPNGSSSPSILGSRVVSITVSNGGTGYTTATISFTDGGGCGGSGAEATATIVSGVITAIAINPFRRGTGYTSAPTVVITGDGTGAVATAILEAIVISVFPGDPLKLNLDALLKAGDNVVAVFGTRAMTRNTTRFRRDYADAIKQIATLSVTIASNTVTIGGTVSVDQACMVIVNNIGYSYRALVNDTLNTIAAALAALIPNAVAVNNVITITLSRPYTLLGRVSVPGTARRILHSKEGVFRARIIAADHVPRETIGNAVELAFADFGYYLPMPDLINASIKPAAGGQDINSYELDLAYVRDYLYLIEYHVVEVKAFQSIADTSVTASVN